jgi:hypothetical protein
MRVIVALIKPKGKSEKEILKTLIDAGLEVHDIKTMNVAKTTKLVAK